MILRKDNGVYVMDVIYADGTAGVITLDSGAGMSVWPKTLQTQVPMTRKSDIHLTAANGTAIENLGNKVIQFKGKRAPDFIRRV